MPRFVSVALVAAVATLSACSGLEPEPIGPELPLTRLRAEPYSFTFYSGLDSPQRLVVRDDASWQTLWNEIHSRGTPVPPVPAIDFSREMIVVAAMGTRSTGGYGILLESASEYGTDGIAISVLSISPGSNCGVTLAFTTPVDIARLPLHPGPVRFIERGETTVCG
jgi:hypothetical protein